MATGDKHAVLEREACSKIAAYAETVLPSASKELRAVVLVLSGSFSPVHDGHVRCFLAAKAHLDSRGDCLVVGGFLAPSSDAYVRAKLRKDAIALVHRNAMAAIAVADYPWLAVWPSGDASSERTARTITLALSRGVLAEIPNELVVMEMGGADYCYKYGLWHVRGSPMICLAREPHTSEIREAMRREGAPDNPDFVLIDDADVLIDVSSTHIRQYLAAHASGAASADEAAQLHMHVGVLNYLLDHRGRLGVL